MTRDDLRGFIMARLEQVAGEKGLTLGPVEETSDLLALGVLDSLGFVQMLMAMEGEFGLEMDLAELDPEEFTTLGGLLNTALAAGAAD